MYRLIIGYDDCTSKTEVADLSNIMRALAIYIEDPNFFIAHIINCETGEVVAQWGKGNDGKMHPLGSAH